MEQPEIPSTNHSAEAPESHVRPALALAIEDVGNLDAVLRGYYLSQIKHLEKRKDRKLARRLLEDHLVLPKSRQRTSKDAAYIKEVLDIEPPLLSSLENSRLIRRIHKTGNNPIYEVSHDTLVEPILAEKRDREAIARFIKRTWKYLVLLLLLWFLFGMLFENSFELLPAFAEKPRSFEMDAGKQRLTVGGQGASLVLPLSPLVVEEELRSGDSIFVRLPIEVIPGASIGLDGSGMADTIAIQLTNPIEVPLAARERAETYQAFTDVVVPLAFRAGHSAGEEAKPVYAKLSGNLKMTNDLDVLTEKGVSEYDNSRRPIELNLGDTLLQASKASQTVPVSFSMRLTDLFQTEDEKNNIRNTLGDRPVTMNYLVQVRPGEVAPPTTRVEYPSVQGIEVQYSDGTSRFIPGSSDTEKTHTVAAGETLFSIAKKYGIVDAEGNTSTQAIKELNGLQGNAISVGQVLRIPN